MKLLLIFFRKILKKTFSFTFNLMKIVFFFLKMRWESDYVEGRVELIIVGLNVGH